MDTSPLDEARELLEEAISCYAQTYQLVSSDGEDNGGFALSFVAVIEVTSPALDAQGRWTIAHVAPPTQRDIYTTGLLAQAMRDDGEYNKSVDND